MIEFCLTVANNAIGFHIILTFTMCYNFQKHCTRTNETSVYVFVFNISLFRDWIRERVKGSTRGGMVVEEIVVEGTIV